MKLDDIPFLAKNIDDHMPHITPNIMWLKRCSFGKLPRSIPNFFKKYDKKFIDNNQHWIEEIAHVFPENPIPKWMQLYQLRHFLKSDILNHDSFYGARIRDGFRNFCSPNFTEIREIGVYGNTRGYFNEYGKVFGATLESANGATLNGDFNFIVSKPDSTGNVGEFYNQIAVNISTASGNGNIGSYDDSSGPNNLQCETGSFSQTADFNFKSVTEFALTTATIWLAALDDNGTCRFKYKTGYSSGDGKEKAQSFGALPNPYGTAGADQTYKCNMKLGHS